jgi:hypothetical protein
VIALDVAATANVLAGNADDPALDGVNLIPYLTGQNTGAPHDALYWRWVGQSAIRKGQWKYLRGDDREYLFDMENDISESTNLLSRHPEIAKQLHSELAAWSRKLLPPGISEPMPNAGKGYFDWYLDGNREPPSKEEANGTAERRAAINAKIFERCDANQDGVVTFDEYAATRPDVRTGRLRRSYNKFLPKGARVWKKEHPR